MIPTATATWERLGFVAPPAGLEWARTHAYVPTPLLINEKTIRVFCAFWDENSVGRLGYIDVLADSPTTAIGSSKQPVLDIGASGRFDEHGITPISLVTENDGSLRLYYVGWQRLTDGKYTMLMGAARSENQGESFTRISEDAVLPTTEEEPYMRTAAFVSNTGAGWQMWYSAILDWVEVNGKLVPMSELRYAESADGINWPARGTSLVLPRTEEEFGFGRPYVFFENGRYRMWFSYRHTKKFYRIGYAESPDGINWKRDDSFGLDASDEGWDSKMTCFPAVLPTNGQHYMFYNGNDYGKDGFGVLRMCSNNEKTIP